VTPKPHDLVLDDPAIEGALAFVGGPYGNDRALRAVLEDACRRSAARIFCLGDLGGFGPRPERILPLLDEFDVTILAGNYDLALAERQGDCGCGYTHPEDNRFARIAYAYTSRRTSDAERARLGTLPSRIRFTRADKRVLLCHGSPRRVNEFLWDSACSDTFLERVAAEAGADLVLCSHTGIPWKRTLPSGTRFVNAGAVGRPANDGRTAARYAWLPAESDEAEFIPVPYDHETVAAEIEREGLPPEFADTIRSGFWTTCLEVLPAKERARGRY
jgi:diadenosine tetraphosphatase ApaH/serine/threonine PP2A family protein phosphatase